MTWFGKGLTYDSQIVEVGKSMCDLDMSSLAEKRERLHFDLDGAMKLGMDTRVSTVALTLLSWRFPHGFMDTQTFSWRPAPWVLSCKALKMLFFSGRSAVSLTFGYRQVLFKISVRSPGPRKEAELWIWWNVTTCRRWPMPPDWNDTAWESRLHQTLAVRAEYEWRMVWVKGGGDL